MKPFENIDLQEEAGKRWGQTDAYRAYEEKTKDLDAAQWNALGARMQEIFEAFKASMKKGDKPTSTQAQALVKQLQDHITHNYYTCTCEILAGLGQMYTADQRFRENIDGDTPGTAEFVSQAIAAYCKK